MAFFLLLLLFICLIFFTSKNQFMGDSVDDDDNDERLKSKSLQLHMRNDVKRRPLYQIYTDFLFFFLLLFREIYYAIHNREDDDERTNERTNRRRHIPIPIASIQSGRILHLFCVTHSHTNSLNERLHDTLRNGKLVTKLK